MYLSELIYKLAAIKEEFDNDLPVWTKEIDNGNTYREIVDVNSLWPMSVNGHVYLEVAPFISVSDVLGNQPPTR